MSNILTCSALQQKQVKIRSLRFHLTNVGSSMNAGYVQHDKVWLIMQLQHNSL